MTLYNPLQLLPPLPPFTWDPKPVPSALTVDPFSDILWVGSSAGITTAYCSPLSLVQNVQFPAHGSKPPGQYVLGKGTHRAVQEIRVTDREIWTLTEGGIGGRKRSGMAKWNVRTVMAASLSGQVEILDPRTGFKQASNITPAQAHSGGLSGADAQGHLVCTWGWTHMQGHPHPDPLLRLYDVRTLRALPSISFPAGVAFALLHPRDPSNLIVCSQSGMLQVIDMSTGGAGNYQQLDVNSYVTSMTMSPAGDYLAFGDADGQIHLWTQHDTSENALDENGSFALPPFNGYDGVKPEWPDQVEAPPAISPLNLIGMPYYTDPLLSNFPTSCYAPVTSPFFNPPEPLPLSVLSTVRMVDFIGYATMPKELKGRRNLVTARPGAGKLATGKGLVRKDGEPRFRSEAQKQKQALAQEEEEKYEIKYSKFGIEDFDFGFFNHTQYSGLETHILNSYTNALLQALHYTLPIRAVAKAHLGSTAKRATSLEHSARHHKVSLAQPTELTSAAALGLMDVNELTPAPYGSLIQSFNRWLLSTFSVEAVVEGETFDLRPRSIENLALSSTPSAINQVLGIETVTTNTCLNCGYTTSRDSIQHVIDLSYPRKVSRQLDNADKQLSDTPSFPTLLRSCIIRESSTKATCSSCKQVTYLESKRALASAADINLPPVLSINAMVSSPETLDVWRDKRNGKEIKRYLPERIAIRVDAAGGLVVDEGEEGIIYQVRVGGSCRSELTTINIFVPPEQVMDTVNIYTNPGRQRKLSLRFLSWFLLKKDIQTNTHDSIEDARYALLLYKLYRSFEEQGRFEDVMEDIFIEGQKTGFKPPSADRPPSPSAFPPLANVLPPNPTRSRGPGQSLKPPSALWTSGPPPAFVPSNPKSRRW
ncbi:PAB-dependent poly(A)-specific ribonuclease subunit 2, partial [Tremellales sp. Uapishka_1]